MYMQLDFGLYSAIIRRAVASPPSAVNGAPRRICLYIDPSDLLASGWPRATRKRKASQLAHAHTAAKCNSTVQGAKAA